MNCINVTIIRENLLIYVQTYGYGGYGKQKFLEKEKILKKILWGVIYGFFYQCSQNVVKLSQKQVW